MNCVQAFSQSSKTGAKITHQYFTNDEWAIVSPDMQTITFEDGVKCTRDEFWSDRNGSDWFNNWEFWEPVK